VQPIPDFTPIEVEDLDSTTRGDKGFGSSGWQLAIILELDLYCLRFFIL
jgi:hypothetical protein